MKLLLALLAGFLTTLSPCVLPVLPFVTTSSFNKNKLGPLFLGIGLLISFVGVSLLVSSTGYLLGIDTSVGRKIAGVLLALSGLLFLSPSLADRFASRLSFLSKIGNKNKGPDDSRPLLSELFGGLLLGVVWTPCSGPSLGAAMGLASQGGSVAKAALILGVFGIGTIIPLMAVAYGARGFVAKLKRNSGTISVLKKTFGALMIAFGALIVTDLDRQLEAKLTSAMPEAWLGFITKF